ncbi:hypothetical protein LCI18_007761 [Fusarium solani-melongenae]|uniref:Uncharacterized protein n=1 Tax=Fusarium solani subsp. cucurbitae TaxID=2747967 RepID=A0ACD3Z6P3_FUSSC|nr:hypothetical protein LCI18_007761 [Fusarium solani-melongenae]
MRPSLLLLPSILGSIWASPAPSPLDDPSLIELGRRADVGQPTINATQCYVTVKGDPGFGSFQAGIPGPAGNKNGDNPVDLVLRAGAGIGAVNFVTNGYLNGFPGSYNSPQPSLDYVKVTGTAASFQADVDFSNVPSLQQPQHFTTAMRTTVNGPFGPVTTYPVGSGWLGMKIPEPTAQNTREVTGAFYFITGLPRYIGTFTGSCFGMVTLPLNLA